jgi:hypothetical protein
MTQSDVYNAAISDAAKAVSCTKLDPKDSPVGIWNGAIDKAEQAVVALLRPAPGPGEWTEQPFVTVPREPTEAMVNAGAAAFTNVRDIWRAMLDAAK